MPILKFASEIFQEFTQAKNKKSRVDVLDKYSTHPTFPWVIDFIFNPKYEFHVPKPFPEYNLNDSPLGLNETHLHEQMKHLYLFLKGNPAAEKIDNAKRTEVLIQILEGLHPAESEVFIAMLKKQSPIKYLTKSLVEEVYPKMFGIQTNVQPVQEKEEEIASV